MLRVMVSPPAITRRIIDFHFYAFCPLIQPFDSIKYAGSDLFVTRATGGAAVDFQTAWRCRYAENFGKVGRCRFCGYRIRVFNSESLKELFMQGGGGGLRIFYWGTYGLYLLRIRKRSIPFSSAYRDTP